MTVSKNIPAWALLGLSLLTAACIEPKPGTDRAGDGGPAIDASPNDTGALDTGGDGGTLDTGADVGPMDLGPDSGPIDVGPNDDATITDGMIGDADVLDANLPDATPFDGGGDAGPGLPMAFGTTNGGGRATSASYILQLKTGGPAPVGRGQSTSYRLFIGAGSGR